MKEMMKVAVAPLWMCMCMYVWSDGCKALCVGQCRARLCSVRMFNDGNRDRAGKQWRNERGGKGQERRQGGRHRHAQTRQALDQTQTDQLAKWEAKVRGTATRRTLTGEKNRRFLSDSSVVGSPCRLDPAPSPAPSSLGRREVRSVGAGWGRVCRW